jgi:6-phosphogluconolactonase
MTLGTRLFVGCYTKVSPTGLHVLERSEPGDGWSERSHVDGIEHLSYLALHPTGRVLYAASEVEAPDAGEVIAFAIDAEDGSLTPIDRTPSHGDAPCYVSTDREGRHLYVANYRSGTVAAYTLSADGRFGDLVAVVQHRGAGPHPRQDGPHAHCILADPSGRSIHAVDLGTDRIVRYVHTEADGLRPVGEVVLRAGSGPRHLAFHPHAPVAFVLCELDSTVVVLDRDPTTGELTTRGAVSTLPIEFAGTSIAADLHVHPAGHRVYVSNRGHDSLATFAFDESDRTLVALGHVSCGGRTPRGFTIDPSGRTLLVGNQDSGTIVEFALDSETGLPEQVATSATISEPVCLVMLEIAR